MKLALAAVVMSSTVLAAPCKRPQLLPAAVPLMDCPARAVGGECSTHCPENGQYVDLYYRGDAKTLAGRWRKTLESEGWDTRASDLSLDPDRPGEPRRRAFGVVATKGHERVSSVVIAAPKGETLVSLTYTPG